MRILLISFNRYNQPFHVFPLGAAYVADALIEAGHEVMLVDLNLEDASWFENARVFRPEIVGVSIRNIDEVNIDKPDTLLGGLDELVAKCRKICAGPIAIGGPAVSLFPNEVLAISGADYAMCGEGEAAFRIFAKAVSDGSIPNYPWLIKRGENRRPSSAPSHFCVKFDEAVRRPIAQFYLEKSRMLNIQTQRGCPLKCCYCTYPSIEGSHVRRKDVEAVVEELRVIKRLGARYFFVVDGVFNTSNEYVAKLCEAMIRAKLDLKWCCFIRPADIDGDLAAIMARAGLAHAECGSDTLSDSMLKSYRKNFTYSQILESSLNLLSAGIKICHYEIFGGPGETEATVRETFERSREMPGGIFFSSTGLRVYPGTQLHRTIVGQRLELKAEPMLRPFYYVSPEFTEKSIDNLIGKLANGRSEWIVPPIASRISDDIRKMRQKGILGPLWDYMELMQRFAFARESEGESNA